MDTQKPSFNEPLAKNKLAMFSRKSKSEPCSAKRKIDIVIFFRDYLSRAKAGSVICWISSGMKCPFHCHKMVCLTLELGRNFLTF